MFDNFFYTTLHPELYHGHRRKAPYFEGWYYKLVSASENQRYAVIPGVSLSGDAHAFVQVLDGVSGQTAYHRYPLADFHAEPRAFEVRIGPNLFTRRSMILDIRRVEGQVQGELSFTNLTPWPASLVSPGIMGWYAWVSFMECYHDVISLDHRIYGTLRINGSETDFSGGAGYIEKDWGQSFPTAWIWLQCNHFDQPRTSLTASVAVIPWLGSAFPGFIVGLWHDGRLYRFTTYLGAQIEQLELDDHEVVWWLRNGRYRLQLCAQRAEGGTLGGPSKADMGRRVPETLSAAVEVVLSTTDGRTLLHSRGRHAGLEVVGDLPRLLQMVRRGATG